MDDITNPEVAAAESTAVESADNSEGSTEKASSPQTGSDWKEGARSASRDDLLALLEEHPEGAGLKERLGQSYADRVLLKDRERITAEVRTQAAREAQEAAWQDKWRNMSRDQRAEFVLQNQEMQENHGRVIGSWWASQSQTVKDAIPELKEKSIEEWQGLFEKHPNSWGETMAALVDEVVKDRVAAIIEKEVPAKAKVMAEAMTKDKIGKTLAGGNGPDIRASGPSGAGSNKTFVTAYAKGESNDHGSAVAWYDALMKG